jgi:hypothetical protein
MIDAGVKRGRFSREEDWEIYTLVKKFGMGQWKAIADHLNTGRTDEEIRMRFKTIFNKINTNHKKK